MTIVNGAGRGVESYESARYVCDEDEIRQGHEVVFLRDAELRGLFSCPLNKASRRRGLVLETVIPQVRQSVAEGSAERRDPVHGNPGCASLPSRSRPAL